MRLVGAVRRRYGRMIGASIMATALVAGSVAAAEATGGSSVGALLPKPGEMHGFVPGKPRAYRTAAALVKLKELKPRQAARETSRFEAEGFVEAAYKRMRGKADPKAEGIATVLAFETPAGANAERKFELKADLDPNALPKGQILRHFKVPGVPKVVAWVYLPDKAAKATGTEAAAGNGLFVDGSCLFLVGNFQPTGEEVTEPVISGIQAIFRRTGGTCP